METGIGAHLRQIGKTGLLVGGLGMLLYGIVATVAEFSFARWLFTFALSAPATALLAFVVVDAARTGVFPLKGGAVTRARQPLAYWLWLAGYAVCGLLLGGLAAWSGCELLAVMWDQAGAAVPASPPD